MEIDPIAPLPIAIQHFEFAIAFHGLAVEETNGILIQESCDSLSETLSERHFDRSSDIRVQQHRRSVRA